MQTATTHKYKNTRLKTGICSWGVPTSWFASGEWHINASLSFVLSLPVISLLAPPSISHLAGANTHTHTHSRANRRARLHFLSPAPAAVPCTDAAAAFLNEYLLKCHYKKWGVMLSLAGVYWRVNVSSYTWNTSLTRWIFTALQYGRTLRDWGLAHLNNVSADDTDSSSSHTCAFTQPIITFIDPCRVAFFLLLKSLKIGT